MAGKYRKQVENYGGEVIDMIESDVDEILTVINVIEGITVIDTAKELLSELLKKLY